MNRFEELFGELQARFKIGPVDISINNMPDTSETTKWQCKKCGNIIHVPKLVIAKMCPVCLSPYADSEG